MTTLPSKSYTVSEVAQRLGISRWTVQSLLRDGELAGFKLKDQWRVTDLALAAFLEKRHVQHK